VTATDHDQQVEALLAALDLNEKCRLTAGEDLWHVAGAPGTGVTALKVTDGPSGARGATFGGVPSACFPCGTALGATWDPDLIAEVGAAIAEEARRKGAQVLLAPTVNIHRHPLAGRNFECPSEDPFLAAAYAAAYVSGVQSRGVAATVKHFVCNDSEFERMTISSEVGERALREIYLAPFEAAVRVAGAWALMTAYNRVNGTYAAEQSELLRLLKDEWGFDGLVMSDWFGTHSTVQSALAGLDLEMPGPPAYLGEKLAAAVAGGEVPAAVVEDMVRRRLRLQLRTGAPEEDGTAEQAVDDPADRALIRRAAAAGMVLLTNSEGILPLGTDTAGSVAVIGPAGDDLGVQGNGSARVEPHRQVSVLEALHERLPGRVRFEPGCRTYRGIPVLERGLRTSGSHGDLAVAAQAGATVEYFDGPDFAGPVVLRERRPRLDLSWLGDFAPGVITSRFSVRARGVFTPGETGPYTFSLVSAGTSRLLVDGAVVVDNWTAPTPGTSFNGFGSERVTAQVALVAGTEYSLELEYCAPEARVVMGVTAGCLPPMPEDQLERAVTLATEADTVVLVVGTGPQWETEGRDREQFALPGRQDELVHRVAVANPRTVVVVNAASPVAMPWARDVGAVLQAWFPGQEGGHAIADVLMGQSEPGGRLPVSIPKELADCPADLTYPGEAGTVAYSEGVFVGYRGYRRRGVAPRFPFGHGLSYTTFEYGPVELDASTLGPGDTLTVRVAVHNTGMRSGSEVVQVYLRDCESTLLRPDRELKGFTRVLLDPGEVREVRVVVPHRAFAAWDPRVHGWVAEPGTFDVLVGASSADIRGTASVELVEDTAVSPTAAAG
jgi:beta-glucosidase